MQTFNLQNNPVIKQHYWIQNNKIVEENYINIFSRFLGKLLMDQKISLKDSVIIMKAFQPVCGSIKSREELVKFIDKHVGYYWELKTLRSQLMDKNHKFIN